MTYKGIDPYYREEQQLPTGEELQLLLEQGGKPMLHYGPARTLTKDLGRTLATGDGD